MGSVSWSWVFQGQPVYLYHTGWLHAAVSDIRTTFSNSLFQVMENSLYSFCKVSARHMLTFQSRLLKSEKGSLRNIVSFSC